MKSWNKWWGVVAILVEGCAADVGDRGGPDAADEPGALGESASELRRNDLSVSEQAVVLKLVDDICGDTWCSGDYDFRFRRIRCQASPHVGRAGSCSLGLQLLPREGVPSVRPDYWRSCRTRDFHGFDSLVVTSANGYQSLQPNYYDALTECISTLEANLPRPELTSGGQKLP